MGPVSPVQSVCTLKDFPDGAAALNELETALREQESRLKELIILWNAPNYRVACDAIRGDAFDSALAEEANKLLSDAVARDEKLNKRKSDSAGWGGGASRRNACSGDGWGPRNNQAGGDWVVLVSLLLVVAGVLVALEKGAMMKNVAPITAVVGV